MRYEDEMKKCIKHLAQYLAHYKNSTNVCHDYCSWGCEHFQKQKELSLTGILQV